MPVVAIIGRPNVGKSTLFNRLLGERKSVTSERAGTTRDRIYGRAEWNGRAFLAVDTGGLVSHPETGIEAGIREQALQAVGEADVVLFLVDGRDEPVVEDYDVAALLRPLGRRSVVVANKVEREAEEATAFLASRLGLDNPFPISALHGRGIGELLDAVVERLPAAEPVEETDSIRLAVIGRPNVGKSSLVNALVGSPQVLVTDEPGTTRDAVDTRIERGGSRYTLIDTAGLRRRSHVDDEVEYFATLRTLKSLESCDVALVLFDATREPEKQDLRVAGMPVSFGRGVVLLVNKWDLSSGDESAQRTLYRDRLPLLRWAPLRFISATTGQGVDGILPLARRVHEERSRRVTTRDLAESVRVATLKHPAPGDAGPIVFGTQVGSAPPTFLLFVRKPEAVTPGYVRYLEGTLREAYGFRGTPIRILLRRKRERKRERKRDHWAS